MKIPTITIVAVLVGAALGAMGSEALKAQVPPAAFVVGEIDVENAPAYFKEYVPVAAQAVVDGGGKYVVRNGKSVSLYGEFHPKHWPSCSSRAWRKRRRCSAPRPTPMPRRSATNMRSFGSMRWRDCSRAPFGVRPFLLTVVQGADEAHFFLSCSNSISPGSPVSASPAASWNLRIASRVAGPTVP
jgi:hypothetical protein